MMSSQLGRMLLSRSATSADEQKGHADESGSYGDLMDAIDQPIEGVADADPSR